MPFNSWFSPCCAGNGNFQPLAIELNKDDCHLYGCSFLCRAGNGNTKPNQHVFYPFSAMFSSVWSVLCYLSDLPPGNLFQIFNLNQVGHLDQWSSWWVVPFAYIILLLFATGRWLLSLLSCIYRNCDHWAPFSLPTYHQLKIPLLFTVCSPSLWAAQWWSSCANYCLADVLTLWGSILKTFYGDFRTLLLVFSTFVGNSRALAETSLGE